MLRMSDYSTFMSCDDCFAAIPGTRYGKQGRLLTFSQLFGAGGGRFEEIAPKTCNRCTFLSQSKVQALQASVDAGPHDETLSTGRPLAATPGAPLKHFCRMQFNLSISENGSLSSWPRCTGTAFHAHTGPGRLGQI